MEYSSITVCLVDNCIVKSGNRLSDCCRNNSSGNCSSLLATGTVSPELLVLAVGTGSVFGSHVNDSGFWIFKEFFQISLKQTFLSWTVMETLISILGLVGVMVLSAVI